MPKDKSKWILVVAKAKKYLQEELKLSSISEVDNLISNYNIKYTEIFKKLD